MVRNGEYGLENGAYDGHASVEAGVWAREAHVYTLSRVI